VVLGAAVTVDGEALAELEDTLEEAQEQMTKPPVTVVVVLILMLEQYKSVRSRTLVQVTLKSLKFNIINFTKPTFSVGFLFSPLL
jgi:hypothetical protein